ncbi:hypothetical protein GOV10_06580, partial [Candidatus Woesearchaeota archaeon]|nr:hypothetical protein [Candidatus Woesearchaeota archaeon]
KKYGMVVATVINYRYALDKDKDFIPFAVEAVLQDDISKSRLYDLILDDSKFFVTRSSLADAAGVTENTARPLLKQLKQNVFISGTLRDRLKAYIPLWSEQEEDRDEKTLRERFNKALSGVGGEK